MKHYEIMYIIPVKVGVDEDTTTQDKVRQLLLENGAKITSEENLGKRKLAYAIDHLRHGTYVTIECNLEPANLARISNWFRLSHEVLRNQIVAKQQKTPEQIARTKAFQEKLSRLQAKNEAGEEVTPMAKKETAPTAPKPSIKLDELDQKLDAILEKEIVK